MSKYYVKYDCGVKCKNSAEHSADEYARTLDGILLPNEAQKENFLKEVKNTIDKINLQNRRCKDVRFSTWKSESHNISLGEGLCYLRIYTVKKELCI